LTLRAADFVLTVLEHQWEKRFERMAKRGFFSRHGIVRNAIREDMLFFAIPAVLVFFAGLVVSARDGYEGLLPIIWNLVRQPRSLYLLSLPNIAGLALAVFGFFILLVAMGTLRWFHASTLVIREDHQLITHGVYRFTRHPIYLAVILVAIGVPLYASSMYGLLTMFALIPIFLTRIRIEERLLTDEFGDAYRTYQETTSKLIPFIY
jgi:protein-S-isoprenylcysteine O-methyltransferase Ste14